MAKPLVLAFAIAGSLIALVVVVLLVLRAFFLQVFSIPSEGMSPTYDVGDRVVVDKRATAQRGDVVAITVLETRQGEEVTLLKRVVAVGGDVVSFRDGDLVLNEQVIAEDYVLNPGVTDAGPTGETPVQVADGQLYVLGDNRENSEDSRYFGTVGEDNLVGVVVWSMPDNL